jgi:hypothetical protein
MQGKMREFVEKENFRKKTRNITPWRQNSMTKASDVNISLFV